jgi:hypothetical protein
LWIKADAGWLSPKRLVKLDHRGGAGFPVDVKAPLEKDGLSPRASAQAGMAEIDRRRAPVQQVLSEARNLDVDLEQRDRIAAFDSDLDLVGIDGDVPADRRENLLVKNGNEVGVARPPSLMHQQDL